MNILIAPDSFKDSLPALDVSHALMAGLKSVDPKVKVSLFPMADGGEGTSDILNYHLSGRWQVPKVKDPLQRIIKSRYLILNDSNTAVIELAKASGLDLLESSERNPLKTTTFGTGELLCHALDNGAEEIILTIGGSATVDGGTGIAAALGFKFFDKHNNEFIPTGGTLQYIDRIDASGLHSRFYKTKWIIASDVKNILTGDEGAAPVYGPQKGADEQMVQILARGLSHLSNIIARDTGYIANHHPGTGAAGGAALFLSAYGKALIKPGFDIAAELTHFKNALQTASIVITGEGKLDAQTQYGKVVSSISHLVQPMNLPLIVVCGAVDADRDSIRSNLKINDLYVISDRSDDIVDAMKHASIYLEAIGSEIARKYLNNKSTKQGDNA